LIIHNHFLPGNRYGYPGHLPEFGGLGGFEVNFLPEYKALHDAGYNILCYDIPSMTTLLLSVCLGGDSTCVAMAKHPEEFEHIKSLILLQPVSASYIIEEFVKANNIPDGYTRFDKALSERTGFHLAEPPLPCATCATARQPPPVAEG
jgi:uncharacterized protein